MPLNIKRLSFWDLVLGRDGPLVFRVLLVAFGTALRLFFRRIETVNADVVPEGPGVIFVLNHPNGLVDPALVFVALPRRISFLAKSTLFRMPVISFFLRTVEALPVYRKVDAGEDLSKNQETFELSRQLLKRGGSIALFPEGISHNSPKLLPLKTGAARIALGAASVGRNANGLAVYIVPVGLFYTNKTTFRSEAMLFFGEPFRVQPVELDEDKQPPRPAVKELTARIEQALRSVTVNAETESDLQTARLAEEIMATAEVNADLAEKLEFLRSFVQETEASAGSLSRDELTARIHKFDEKLKLLRLEPAHLSLAEYSRSSIVRSAIRLAWPVVLLAPFALVGSILHYPAYRFSGVIADRLAKHGADDVASTVKVLAGMVFVPATWLITAAVVYYFLGWKAAAISLPVTAACGYAALYSSEQIAELGGWARAIFFFFARREHFLRLYAERHGLIGRLEKFDQ